MLNNLRLLNFRSYRDDVFEFDNSINIIVGPNAIGKTNLIEAIIFILKGSSFRVKDSDLINYGQKFLRVETNINNEQRIGLISKTAEKSNKTFKINDKTIKRLSKNHIYPSVLFEPNHLNLFILNKEYRRKYLDELVASINPEHSKLTTSYQRVLLQRNNLLKKNKIKELFPWNIRLSQLSGQIIKNRITLINTINPEVESIYQRISDSNTKIYLKYIGSLDYQDHETKFLKYLEEEALSDQLKGFTQKGAHRDDFSVEINQKNSNQNASRGELRSIVMSLKISEKNILEERFNQKIIFILDDVFSELDGQRRKYLLNELKNNQTFITTTDADMVINHLNNRYKIIALI